MSGWMTARVKRLRQALRRWRDDDGGLLAAAMAYYAVLAFFPLLLILVSGLGLVLRYSGRAQDTQATLLDMLGQSTSSALAGHVQNALAAVQSGASFGGPLGLAVLLATGIGMFTQLDKIMDQIWGRKRHHSEGVLAAVRQVLFHRLRAFLMLIGLGMLVLVALVANLVASAVRPYVVELADGRTWTLLQTAASLVANGALLTTIHVVLPKARVTWREAARGGILAAILWEITRQVLSLAVFGRQYSAYGLVGSVLILMIWVYVACAVFVFSVQYVLVWRDNSEKTSPEGANE